MEVLVGVEGGEEEGGFFCAEEGAGARKHVRYMSFGLRWFLWLCWQKVVVPSR